MGSCTLTVVASQTKNEILCRCSRLSCLCLRRSCPRRLCWLWLRWPPRWLCCFPLCLWLHRLRGSPANCLRCCPLAGVYAGVDPSVAYANLYPAAEPYVHEDIAAEAYVDAEIPAEQYVDVQVAAEPYIHQDIAAE